MKFGGSSVGTATSILQVLSIILNEHKRWDRFVLVVSALDGVTDSLLEASQLAQLNHQRGYRRIVAMLRTRHLALLEQLSLGASERNLLRAEIDSLLFDMLDNCQNIAEFPDESHIAEYTDAIICIGERLSTRIIAALLRDNGIRGVEIDATNLIVTDNNFGNAQPDFQHTQHKIDENLIPILEGEIVPVITGFLGETLDKRVTTLGRGGSDFTASIIGICIQADEVWMWSDVDGIMSADPHEISDAHIISEMTYDEVAELAYFGARILHTKMISPLQSNRIPLRIRNVNKPKHPGTIIQESHREFTNQIKAVTSIPGIGINAQQNSRLSKIYNIIDQTLYESIGSHSDVIISSQSSKESFISFVIPTTGIGFADTIEINLKKNLREVYPDETWQIRPVSVITVIGNRFNQIPQLAAQILESLQNIQILALSQGASHYSLSIVTEPQFAETAVQQIHASVIKNG